MYHAQVFDTDKLSLLTKFVKIIISSFTTERDFFPFLLKHHHTIREALVECAENTGMIFRCIYFFWIEASYAKS